MHNSLTPALLFVCALSVLFAGCAEEDLFLPCPFDKAINEVCKADLAGEENDLTCVVQQHPQCPHDVCIKWQSGDSHCTKKCKPDGGNCPEDSTCAAFNELDELYYCVPNEHLK